MAMMIEEEGPGEKHFRLCPVGKKDGKQIGCFHCKTEKLVRVEQHKAI
jgi:hypothetical protein